MRKWENYILILNSNEMYFVFFYVNAFLFIFVPSF